MRSLSRTALPCWFSPTPAYGTKEETVGTRSTIDVLLAAGVDLSQVVVVGYGTQRKVDLTGAVGSVTSKDFESKPVTSADQILGGRISGIHMANRSGNPGAPVEVRIRGAGLGEKIGKKVLERLNSNTEK